MTSPRSGSTISGTTTVSASVTIVGGLTVRGVQFKLDGNNLGAEDTVVPFSVPWNTTTATNGSHILTAVARDLLGVLWTSAPVTVSVDNIPPAVGINQATGQADPTNASPINFRVVFSEPVSDFTGADVAITGTAGGVKTVALTGGPSTYNVAVSGMTNGTVIARIAAGVARDAAGNVNTASTSTDNTVIFDTVAPTVTINQAVGQADPINASPIRFTAVFSEPVTDFTGVDVTIAGTAGGAKTVAVTGGPSTYNLAVSGMTNGTVVATISAGVARDAAGNPSAGSTSTDNQVTFDAIAPAAPSAPDLAAASDSGVSSADNLTNDNTPTFTGTAEAGSSVKIFSDGMQVGSGAATGGNYSITTSPLSNGTHSITATATDAASNVSSLSGALSARINTSAPTVGVTSPASGVTVSGTVPVTAGASDDVGVAGVQFFVDGAPLGAEDMGNPYSADWNTTTAANGSQHTLTAVARDAAGNGATSAAVTVTVSNDTTPPTVTVDQATGQADPASASPINFTVVFSESVSDFTGADVTIAGTAGGTRTAAVTGGPSAYNVAVSGMTNGTVIATIPAGVARDAAGNTNTASTSTDNSVTFGTVAPTVTINQAAGQADPTNGSPINFTVVFSAPVTDFTGADVTITGTAGGTRTAAVTGGPSNYNVSVSGITNGTVIATVPAGVARDAADTANTASTSTDNSVLFNTSPPTVAVTSPAGGTASDTVTVTASASDDVGVAGVRFFVDGAPLGAEDTSSPYSAAWDTTSLANGSQHTLTAEARDAAGNTSTSASVTVTVSNAPPPPSTGATRFEHTDPSVTYTDGWFQGSRSRAWSGGTAAVSRTAGARATFTFTGTSVSWIGFRGPWTGTGRVFLDGAFVEEVDTYSATEAVNVVIFTATGLAAGSHTLAIEPTGLRNPAATDNSMWVDAFDVTPSVPLPTLGTRSEETNPSVAYTAGWTQGDAARAWSGGTAAVAATPGARATFTFRGTSVSWIGLRGPQTGIARLSLDGSFAAEVDTFSATEIQAVVFTLTGLAAGTHTLAIEATGDRNSAATNTLIMVDAFDVRARFEETDPSVTFTGSWGQGNTNRAWSGTSESTGTGTAALTTAGGFQATFTFRGTAVSWISFRGPQTGIARVSLDGAFVQEVDTFSPTEEVQAVVFTATGLADTNHSLTIEATGRLNPAATGAIVTVDAFDVTLPASAPQVTRLQETDPSIMYTGAWAPNGSTTWSGRSAAVSGVTGDRATFNFTGTSVRWIGYRSKATGIARVLVDGVFVGDVDLYTDNEQIQVPVFTTTGLAAGSHTLTIEVTGLRNPAGENTLIVIDAFDVIP